MTNCASVVNIIDQVIGHQVMMSSTGQLANYARIERQLTTRLVFKYALLQPLLNKVAIDEGAEKRSSGVVTSGVWRQCGAINWSGVGLLIERSWVRLPALH